jgi:hypothetical protein
MSGCISTVFVDERSSFFKGDINMWAYLKLSVVLPGCSQRFANQLKTTPNPTFSKMTMMIYDNSNEE